MARLGIPYPTANIITHSNLEIYGYLLYDASGVVLIIHNLKNSCLKCCLELSPYIKNEPFTIIFGEEDADLCIEDGLATVERIEPYHSVAVLFKQVPLNRFIEFKTGVCRLPFPRYTSVQSLSFWLLPQIRIEGLVDSMIIYQHATGEKKPILYRKVAQTIPPGIRSKESMIFHYDKDAFYFIIHRDQLPLPQYRLSAIVWSAEGNWLDKPPIKGPIIEALPQADPGISPPSFETVDTFLSIKS